MVQRERQRSVVPYRYLVAVMASLSEILYVGVRASFALVMTHLTAANQTQSVSTDIFFSKCPVSNSTSDLEVEFDSDVAFLQHTVFYVIFTLTIVPGSLLSTGISTKTVTCATQVVYTFSALMLPLAIRYSVTSVYILRSIQGAMEGIQQPAFRQVFAAWSSTEDRSRLFAIYIFGIYIAPALASLVTASAICFVSWDSVFYIYGGAGMVWITAWFFTFYETPEVHPSLSVEERQFLKRKGDRTRQRSKELLKSIPWRAILTSPPVWGVFVGCFSASILFAIMVMEQPQYYQDAFGIKLQDIGVLSMVPYLVQAVLSILSGIIADKLINNGVSRTITRKLVFSTAFGIEGLCLVGLYFVSDWKTAFVIMCIGLPIGGMANAGFGPLACEMSPHFASVVGGLTLSGSVGAALSTALASAIAGAKRTLSSWQKVFMTVGLIHLCCVLLFDILVDARQQPWAELTLLSSNKQTSNNMDGSFEDETSLMRGTEDHDSLLRPSNPNYETEDDLSCDPYDSVKKYGTL